MGQRGQMALVTRMRSTWNRPTSRVAWRDMETSLAR